MQQMAASTTQTQPPQSQPHPSQVRSACERCRRQKLGCQRNPASAASCSRCLRLGLQCQAGLQRRVGRPLKKDLAPRLPCSAGTIGVSSPGTGTITAGVTAAVTSSSITATPLPCPTSAVAALVSTPLTPPDAMSTDASGLGPYVPFLPGLLDDPVPGLEWTDARFCSAGPILQADPSTNPPEFQPQSAEQHVIFPRNSHFRTLSRLNADIHRGLQKAATTIDNGMTFKQYICGDDLHMSGFENMQMLMRSSQDFLVIVKALHRQQGTREIHRQIQAPPSWDFSTFNIDPSFVDSGQGSDESSPNALDDCSPVEVTLDSPTMFLVVSCYAQLIKHIEILFNLIYACLMNHDQPPTGPAPIAYADVPLVEAPIQFILFAELIIQVLGQLNLVMGIPSKWSRRTVWAGLLRSQRYREMLNSELGQVEGLWTTRPTKLLDLTRTMKDLWVERSMIGVEY